MNNQEILQKIVAYIEAIMVDKYYALPKGTLKEDIPLSISIKELAKLSNVSSLEKTYHILHEDDRELSCILKNCLTAPTAPKDASESE